MRAEGDQEDSKIKAVALNFLAYLSRRTEKFTIGSNQRCGAATYCYYQPLCPSFDNFFTSSNVDEEEDDDALDMMMMKKKMTVMRMMTRNIKTKTYPTCSA